MLNVPSNFKWSFSSISAYSQCPQMFRLQYIDRIPQQNNAFAQYGSLVHSLLEEYEKGEIPSFALAEEYEARYDESVTAPWPPFPKGMPQKYYDQGLQYLESFDGFGDQYEIISVEEKFELNIEGYPLVGLADLVLRDKSTGEITVIDHKSKSSSTMQKDLPTYRKQLYIYAAYVKEKFGVYPKYLKFNLFRENEWVTEEFDIDMFNKTMKWVVETIESILFETEWKVSCSSYFCRFVCSVFDSCPAKEAVLNPPPKEKKEKKNE